MSSSRRVASSLILSSLDLTKKPFCLAMSSAVGSASTGAAGAPLTAAIPTLAAPPARAAAASANPALTVRLALAIVNKSFCSPIALSPPI